MVRWQAKGHLSIYHLGLTCAVNQAVQEKLAHDRLNKDSDWRLSSDKELDRCIQIEREM